MKRRITILQLIFVAITSFVFAIGGYILMIYKNHFFPQSFITFCREFLINKQNLLFFDSYAISFILMGSVTFLGVTLAIFLIVNMTRTHMQLKKKIEFQEKIPFKIKKILKVHQIPESTVAMVGEKHLIAYTAGVFHPQIIISRLLVDTATEKELEAIVLHEFCHIQNHHIIWLIYTQVASSLFFFIPIIAYLARQLKTEFEYSADTFVVQIQHTRKHICSSLALCLYHNGTVSPHFSTSPIEKRIDSLISNKLSPIEKIGGIRLGISIFAVALMFLLAAIDSTQFIFANDSKHSMICQVADECQMTGCMSNGEI